MNCWWHIGQLWKHPLSFRTYLSSHFQFCVTITTSQILSNWSLLTHSKSKNWMGSEHREVNLHRFHFNISLPFKVNIDELTQKSKDKLTNWKCLLQICLLNLWTIYWSVWMPKENILRKSFLTFTTHIRFDTFRKPTTLTLVSTRDIDDTFSTFLANILEISKGKK